MVDLVAIDPRILALLRGASGGGVPMPYMQEIFLLECSVAGTSFVGIGEFEGGLCAGDTLVFVREPENSFDELAIVILDQEGHKLGYVPRAMNVILARLMDAGKMIYGVLEKKKWHGDWLRLDIRVCMRDM